MSKKLKLNKVNFDDSDFIVEVKSKKKDKQDFSALNNVDKKDKEETKEAELIINRANSEAEEIVSNAQNKALDMIQKAQEEIEESKQKMLEGANLESEKILQNAKEELESAKEESSILIEKSKEDIEKERIEQTRLGYEEGYKDGLEKVRSELEEKIEAVNNFSKVQLEIKDRIIKSASRDILDLIINISKKILIKEADSSAIEKIIKNSINLLEKKEDVNIILSEKYAKLLFEIQKHTIGGDEEFNFENFKQYEGFRVIYNPKFDDDTIIVENIKERFDGSISSQIDTIVRSIYESTNGQIDLAEFVDENENK